MNAIAPFAPILTLSLGSLVYLLCGGVLERLKATGLLAVILLAAACFMTLSLQVGPLQMEHGVVVSSFTILLGFLACSGALVSVVAGLGTVRREGITALSEYYFLLITALAGALVMIFASDYLTLFIGLEVASLALYSLCAARLDSKPSSEAAMKYFLMGCFSSAFFLYGVALWYGCTGSLQIEWVNPDNIVVPTTAMRILSFVMILVGITFKLGLAPFHFWVPDVYQGAPTSVTTFMSCVVKVAALAALLNIAFATFHLPTTWALAALWVISVVAMTVGNLAALQQRSVKRLLAYSSVSHAGYMLIGLVVTTGDAEAVTALLYYLTSYCAMTVGAFAVLGAIGPDADDIQDFRGLSQRSPILAFAMTMLFLGLAGLPPSLAGLLGKAFLFSSALSAGFVGLAIIAALNSALACAYYFRVPMAIYFQKGEGSEQIKVPPLTSVAILLCVVTVVGIGIYPEVVLGVARDAAASVVRGVGVK
jgi:NADH-quinone oxidoreductase subunit N